jgi:ATP-dependent phosphoenolpyruvate carboxykinase
MDRPSSGAPTAAGMCGHPKHAIFLTYNAFGVLPPSRG